MTDNRVCPSCGAAIEDDSLSQCPFCSTALPANSSSAKTMISSRPISKNAEFGNSAEAMDEIKKLINEGNEAEATQIAAQQFDLKPEDAQNTIAQVEEDLKYNAGATIISNRNVPPPPAVTAQPAYSIPEEKPEVIYTPPSSDSGKKPANKNLIIGGVIGAVIFLCLCCCLPIAYLLMTNFSSN